MHQGDNRGVGVCEGGVFGAGWRLRVGFERCRVGWESGRSRARAGGGWLSPRGDNDTSKVHVRDSNVHQGDNRVCCGWRVGTILRSACSR